MIIVAGSLAALITNDVALFVVIPFTVIAGRISDFDVEDSVALQLIATNLIGCLTPLGNPQNLFLYHRSGWSAAQFVGTMLPFVAGARPGCSPPCSSSAARTRCDSARWHCRIATAGPPLPGRSRSCSCSSKSRGS
jgi:hypothetical protein